MHINTPPHRGMSMYASKANMHLKKTIKSWKHVERSRQKKTGAIR
jgi:hypothetical protein